MSAPDMDAAGRAGADPYAPPRAPAVPMAPEEAARLRREHRAAELRLRVMGVLLILWISIVVIEMYTPPWARHFPNLAEMGYALIVMGLPLACGLSLLFLLPAARFFGSVVALPLLLFGYWTLVPAAWILFLVHFGRTKRVLSPGYSALRPVTDITGWLWLGFTAVATVVVYLVIHRFDSAGSA